MLFNGHSYSYCEWQNYKVKEEKKMRRKWAKWINVQEKDSTMKVEKIPLAKVSGWGMQEDGNFGRPDRKFFQFVGAKISCKEREVSTWIQPLIEEVGQGVVIVLKKNGKESFLLQAKMEPGNYAGTGYVMLNATISASHSNLTQEHGGRKPMHAELIGAEVLKNLVTIPQDGGKYLGKRNFYGVIEIDDAVVAEISLGSNERWFSLEEMREAMEEDRVSEHLAQAMFTYLI